MLNKNHLKKTAITIFLKNTKYSLDDIVDTELIHDGYTNISYHFWLENNEQYQVRIGNDHSIIDRKNELIFLKTANNNDFIYFNIKTGDAIKKWVEGHNPSKKRSTSIFFANRLYKKIKELHKLPINSNMIFHDDKEYLELANLPIKIQQKYLELIDKYKSDKKVFSHNDLNPGNMLILPDKSIHFIDYEWARINNDLWDICNYFREVYMPIWKVRLFCLMHHLNFKKIKDYLFICACYSYQWTFGMQPTAKMKAYQTKIEKLTSHYFNKFY